MKVPELITEMVSKKVRRLFITGTRSFISDRILIAYLFSSPTVNILRREPKRLTYLEVSELGPIDALPVCNNLNVREAATLLLKKKRECLVCENGIVTPWDCAIKPFLMEKVTLF